MKPKGPSRKRLAAVAPVEKQRAPEQPPPEAQPRREVKDMDFSSLDGFTASLIGKDAMFRVSDSFLTEIRNSKQDAVQLWRAMRQKGVTTGIRDEMHHIVANGNQLSEPDITSFETFPGPMAVPMTRRMEPQIRNNNYWLTEKSDGLRVLSLTEETATAAWRTENGALRVSDCILLEMAYQALLKQGLVQSNGNMPLSQAVSKGRSLALKIEEQTLLLVNVADSSDTTKLFRSGKLSVTFCIDRTGIAYAWEYPIVFTGFQTVFFDGELIFSMSHRKPLFIVYDIPAYKTTGSNQYTYLCLEMMSKRIHQISTILSSFSNNVEPNEQAAMPIGIAAKKFWPKHEIEELLGHISPSEGENAMVYSCESFTNHNDGVIFTPEDAKLFPYTQGTCNALLKWKFPQMLTIDWNINRAGPADPVQAYTLSYTVKDKNKDGNWYEEHVPFTTTPLRKRPTVGVVPFGHVVAECSFLKQHGSWLISAIRADKKLANSYITAASVLESIAENITADVLVDAVTGTLSPERPLSKKTKCDRE
eukprot:TRINITY_DN10321_c1_g1_i5.p1 TRINITY_DN10321_c1_g1~~TRINITY_DN10321_c1_g1_i5.p1  ORF type:complete len:547 (+),score=81.93 TRINITY_DN10321_c1_g1_i5:43-1641(+)